ncbi:Esterase PHB depolymerase [Candidatus Bilamarchaeum dharawalense]|uniref:Esterase PHB depolymerase n=1 Tax=Candidatus Bilamarchaeum dharawalense TaxID=2885759 RepID=A0A5E4LTF1_9ARCH|nr:Esterase PHB depolymerase [Candidatus Bilamarchaeum dharawalense]
MKSLVLAVFLILLIVMSGCCRLLDRSEECGNGLCGAKETCSTCQVDCGPCAHCGDGTCINENCSTCSQDCGPCPVENISNLSPGDHDFSFQFGGLTRTYRVYVPTNPKENMPLVLVFHGAGMTGEEVEKGTSFNSKANGEGFVVAYLNGKSCPYNALPNRLGQFWNSGDCTNPCVNADDVGFTRAVIADLKSKTSIDGKRIYAMGFSNGAMLTQRLACEMSTEIAAFVSNSGALSLDYSKCNPSRPISLLHIHGAADNTVVYLGTSNPQLGGAGCNSGKPIPDAIAFWKEKDGCTGADGVVYQKGTTTCTKNSNCAGNSEIELCVVQGGGHTIFNTKDINSVDFAWDFFSGKSLD